MSETPIREWIHIFPIKRDNIFNFLEFLSICQQLRCQELKKILRNRKVLPHYMGYTKWNLQLDVPMIAKTYSNPNKNVPIHMDVLNFEFLILGENLRKFIRSV